MTTASDRKRLLAHAERRWNDVLTDRAKVRVGTLLLRRHRPTGPHTEVIDRALDVLDEEGRWPKIHDAKPPEEGVFSQVRRATLKAVEAKDETAAAVLMSLENLLKTAYNQCWRPGMFPPFDADSRDWIFTCLVAMNERLGGAMDEGLHWPEQLVADE